MIKCLHGVPIKFHCIDCGKEDRVPLTYQDLENECNRLTGRVEEMTQEQQALMDQCVRFEERIAQMMSTLGDQAATIRRLTDERIGPEKPLYEQLKGLGTGLAPTQLCPHHREAYHCAECAKPFED